MRPYRPIHSLLTLEIDLDSFHPVTNSWLSSAKRMEFEANESSTRLPRQRPRTMDGERVWHRVVRELSYLRSSSERERLLTSLSRIFRLSTESNFLKPDSSYFPTHLFMLNICVLVICSSACKCCLEALRTISSLGDIADVLSKDKDIELKKREEEILGDLLLSSQERVEHRLLTFNFRRALNLRSSSTVSGKCFRKANFSRS